MKNLKKISLKPILMSLVIFLGSFSIFNIKIACASNHQNSPDNFDKTSGSSNNNTNDTPPPPPSPFFTCFNWKDFDPQNKDKKKPKLKLTEDMIKTINDLCNNNEE